MYSRYVILSVATVFLSLASSIPLASPLDLDIPYYDSENVDIIVDGKLDEELWKKVPYNDNFLMVTPSTGDKGRYQTHVAYFHTNKGLYVGMWNEQPTDSLLSRLSSRDGFLMRDSMQVIVDTSGKGLYSHWFSVSLGGSIGDGIVLPERDYRSDWDGAWYGNAVATNNGWTAELYIPWSIMNMPPGNTSSRKIGLYVSRTLGQLGERWSNPYLPRGQNRFLSAFKSYQIKSIPPTKEYSLFPYASSSIDNITNEQDSRAGLDIFWKPTSHLQVNATMNPDFGQVEADDVVVNLTAFETFFPEKRLFFLENQSVFSMIKRKGSSDTLLNTRRIGSDIGSRAGEPDKQRTIDTNSSKQPVDLIGAVKTTGQIGKIRYGLIAATEDETEITIDNAVNGSIPGRDFGVLRVLYENAGSGRRSIGWLGTITDHPNRQAVTQGLDAHLFSNDGRLSLDSQILKSSVKDERGKDTHGYGFFTNISFVPRNGHKHKIEMDYIDRQLDLNDIGFLNRSDQLAVRYQYELEETNIPGLRERETDFTIKEERNLNNKRTSGQITLEREWKFNNNSQTKIGIAHDPKKWDDRNSRGFGDFERKEIWSLFSRWKGNSARPLSSEISIFVRQEHEVGYNKGLNASLYFRPTDRYGLTLQARYSSRDSWLIHNGGRNFTAVKAKEWKPKIIFDTFFNAKQQLQIQLQWIGIKAYDRTYWQVPTSGGELQQISRPADDTKNGFATSKLTLQARYRWELAPLSDLFIVYNRGGSLDSANNEETFSSLFSDALSNPASEVLVVKLRYRFGAS